MTPATRPACALTRAGVFARDADRACERYLAAAAAHFFFGARLARSFLRRRSRRTFCAVLRPRFSLGLSPTKGFTSLRNSTDTGVANRSKRSRNTLAR